MKLASRIPCYLCGEPATHTREWPVLGRRFVCAEHDPVPHIPCDYIVQPVDLRPYIAAGLLGCIALAPASLEAIEAIREQGASQSIVLLVGIVAAIAITTIIGGSIGSQQRRTTR